MEKLHWVLDKLTVHNEPGLTNAELMLTNDDLRPVEPERRRWSWLNYVAFWIADSLNINTWMISSSMIVAGLSWWQAWICVWIGYFIAAGFVCLTGRIGAVYHTSFPVTVRASFGIWGSFWPIINRVVMAIIWYGVQGYIGGECVTVMISAIWPSYRNLPNTMSPGAGVTTQGFVSFLLFWLGSLPALWFPVHQIRHLFTMKAYYSPIAAIAFFAWAISRAHGIGPIIHQPNTIHGSALAWQIVKGIMSCIGNFAALIMNDPDFSRFARKPKDALWSQLLTIPIGFGITSFIGIIVTSSASVIYGTEVWSPLTLLDMFLDGASSGQRFGIFIIALGFTLAQLGTNICANSVSAGTDLTALLPRYLNIRRGSYICAAISLAMCPWNLVASSNQFTDYLSAYSLFLSAIAGPMIVDYYIVRRGYLDIKALYSASKTDPYYYTYGFSWRAYASYFSGILMNIVGFVGEVGGPEVPIGAQYIYNINYFSGVIVSGGMYWLLCTVFPIPATSDTWNEVDIDEIEDFTVAYGQEIDEEHVTGYNGRRSISPSDDQKGPSAASSPKKL
ncbi:Uracil permease [Penicillium herquei]|nr:Uracil permease [Penicillium herquei]